MTSVRLAVMPPRELLAVAVLLAALAPRRALGFAGDYHIAISRQSLRETGYERTAADQVIAGNLKTDDEEAEGGEFWTPAAHFDDEQFAAGSTRLRKKLDAAVEALVECKPSLAREQIGRALHAVQDFFAHSNWVENHGPDDPIDLFNLKDPAPGVVCAPGAHKGPLTSGYYYRDERQAAPPGKCLHDGELNKDKPSRPFFPEARARALAESKNVLLLLDKTVLLKYGAGATKEGLFRLRLLKDASPGFKKRRHSCRPGS